MKMISCDWCHSTECRDTGGLEWNCYPIYVCKCGHEFVVMSTAKEKSELELTTEMNRLLDEAILGFGLDEDGQRRLSDIQRKLKGKK